MSSALVLRQRDSVHLMADAASYDRSTGILRAVNNTKCWAIPTLNMAISCTGPSQYGSLICSHLAAKFTSFDDVIESADEYFPELFERMSEQWRAGDAVAGLYLIGWHTLQDRPAAYAMSLWTEGSSTISQVMENNHAWTNTQRSKLIEQDDLAGTPLPGKSLLDAARFEIRDDTNEYDAERDLLHLIEIQRHEQIEGHYWVGGKALLTSIDKVGITQRVVRHWTEDVIGKPISPLPNDFTEFKPDPMAGLSRLKREMLTKKLRKKAA